MLAPSDPSKQIWQLQADYCAADEPLHISNCLVVTRDVTLGFRLPRLPDNGPVCVLRYPGETTCDLGPRAHEGHPSGGGVLQEDHTTHGR